MPPPHLMFLLGHECYCYGFAAAAAAVAGIVVVAVIVVVVICRFIPCRFVTDLLPFSLTCRYTITTYCKVLIYT